MRIQSLAPVVAALGLAGLTAGCSARADQAPPAPPAPAVTVAEVVTRPLRQWDEFTGRVEAIQTVQIRPRVGGYIDSVRFTEGARVRKGQVLFQIDPRPFQAEAARLDAEVAASRAKLDLARANRERGQRLVEQEALARSEYDRLVSEEKAAAASLQAASASLRAARLNLEFTRVTSPIDGRVSRAMITRGNLVTSADQLTTVVSENPIYVSFNTDEQTFLKYGAADRGHSSPVFIGLMTEDGYPHAGKLVFVDNALDGQSGTINGRALFDNADGRFTPGLFARVKLVSNVASPTTLAPDRAIGADLGKRFVLVLAHGDTAEYRAVTLGPRVGDLRIVRDGLKSGDVVVVGGGQKVKPGQVVAPTRIALKLPLDALAQVEAKPISLAENVRANRAVN
jgi:RND family efflux transporter MFP subunit